MSKIGIFGTGDAGFEIFNILKNFSKKKFALVSDLKKKNNLVEIKNVDNFISKKKNLLIIAIQDCKIRKKFYLKFRNKTSFYSINLASYMPKNSIVSEGAIIYPYNIISNDTKIGKFFFSNFSSAVGHDCLIGDFVTFGPKVTCCGNVIIGNNVTIGGHSIIKPGTKKEKIKIGDNSVIGMGSVITKSLPPNSIIRPTAVKNINKS